MSHTESLTIHTRDCDINGRWKPSAILEAMQEVAIDHCESVGLGRGVTDELGIAWVLSRCRVELARVPAYGDALTLETFALPTRHLFFPRGHIIRNPEGEVLGGSLGLWLLLDKDTRKAVSSPLVSGRLPIEDRDMPAKSPATVRALEGANVQAELSPQFSDYDLNGHVNNARYLDWCCNALGVEALREREIACFDINYDREILPGQTIATDLCRDGNLFTFCGLEGGRRCFGIRGEFRAS